MIQRLGDKSCSDQVSLVSSHLSLFLGVINQSQTGGIDRPLAAPRYVYTPRLYLPLSPLLLLNLIGRTYDSPPSDAISKTVHRLTSRWKSIYLFFLLHWGSCFAIILCCNIPGWNTLNPSLCEGEESWDSGTSISRYWTYCQTTTTLYANVFL